MLADSKQDVGMLFAPKPETRCNQGQVGQQIQSQAYDFGLAFGEASGWPSHFAAMNAPEISFLPHRKIWNGIGLS
jgi:hypothetical protein